MWYFTKQFHIHHLLCVSEPLLWDRHQSSWSVRRVWGGGQGEGVGGGSQIHKTQTQILKSPQSGREGVGEPH